MNTNNPDVSTVHDSKGSVVVLDQLRNISLQHVLKGSAKSKISLVTRLSKGVTGHVPVPNKKNVDQILAGLHSGTFPVKEISEGESEVERAASSDVALPDKPAENPSAVEKTPPLPVEDGLKRLRVSKKKRKRAKSLDQGKNPVSNASDEIEEVVAERDAKASKAVATENDEGPVTMSMFREMMKGLEEERKRNHEFRVKVDRELQKGSRSQGTGRLLDTLKAREGSSRKTAGTPSESTASKGGSSSFDTSEMHGETKTLLKKVNEEKVDTYWLERSKRTFQPVDLLDEKPYGRQMLRNALKNHESFSAYAESVKLKSIRNQTEVRALCAVLDSLFFEMGVQAASKSATAEFTVRRMAAVMEADLTGGWTHAEEIEGRGGSGSIMDPEQLSNYHKRNKARQRFRGETPRKTKPASEKGGGDK